MKITKTTEYLKVNFSQGELSEKSSSLAETIKALEQKELRKKEVVKAIDAEIAKLKAEASKLAQDVMNKHEYREVPVEVHWDYARGTKTYIRTDTFDLIKEVSMSADELQTELPIIDVIDESGKGK